MRIQRVRHFCQLRRNCWFLNSSPTQKPTRAGTTASIEYIKAGTLRPLAVTTATRAEVLPDLPTVSDFVPGYELSLVDGIGAPMNTPPEIIERLNKEINAGLALVSKGVMLSSTPSRWSRLDC